VVAKRAVSRWAT